MKYHNDPQGSEAWLAARRGVNTGSRAKDMRDRYADKPEKINKKTGEITEAVIGGPSAKQLGYAMDTAREREGGSLLATYANAAMRTGQEQEPHARRAYEASTGYLVEEVGFITTDDRRFGCSVDGLVDDDGMVEIKTMVSSVTLFTAVVDGDISEYIDQCVFALWLLRRQWCDLILWAPDMAAIGLDLTVIRITRDEAQIDALEADMLAFERRVTGYQAALRAKAEGAPIADEPAPWDVSSPAPVTSPAPRTTAPAALPQDIFA